MAFRSRATAALTLTGALLAVVLAFAGGQAEAAGTTRAATPADTVSPTATPSPSPSPSPSSSPLDTITITSDPGNYVMSAANPTPALSGTITELAPGSTTPMPYTGQIIIDDSVYGNISVTTGTDGSYEYQPSDPVAGETITVEVPATATNMAAAAPPVVLSAQLTLTAKLSASEVRYGTAVTVSGTVSSYAAGGESPLSGQLVQVYAGGGQLATSTETGSAGTFSAALPREATSLEWTVQTGGGPYTMATATLPMTVDLPTVITGFKAALSSFPTWLVSYQGCLGLASGTPGFVPSLAGLTIQYATSPHGPWHALGTVPATQRSYVCGDDGRTFAGKLPGHLSKAYYRAVYAGSTVSPDALGAETGYLSSVSATSRSWLYSDRFIDLKVSPRTVREGGKVTMSGKLEYNNGHKWLTVGRQTVYLIFRPTGSKTWYWIVKVTTNSKGEFTGTSPAPVSATWAAEFQGDTTLLATMSSTVNVRVK
jgi:hypothetical protein